MKNNQYKYKADPSVISKVLINNEWHDFTCVFPHGDEVKILWDDVIFIGTATYDSVKFE